MSIATRVFVSHAVEDSSFAGRLAAGLRDAGVSVWLDAGHAGHDDVRAAYSQAVETCDALLLVLSPAALAAAWIRDEMDIGIARYKQGLMRAPVVILAQTTPLEDVPPLWTAYVWVDATGDEAAALPLLLKALDVAPQPMRPLVGDGSAETPAAQPSPPLPWTPYPEAPALTGAPPLDLSRPSGPAFQRTATPSTPLPWAPYPAGATLSPTNAEAPAYLGRATIPVWDQPKPARSRVWRLAQPLALLIPVGVGAVWVFLRHQDVVIGLRALANAAVAVAVAAAVALGFALALKRARRLVVSGWAVALLVALLAVGVAGGYVLPKRLYTLEGHLYEGHHQWWPAIAEFEHAGETEGEPTYSQTYAPDIARIHDEWGEARLSQGDYSGAVDQFNMARASAQPGDANDARAQRDLYSTYTTWMQADANGIPYPDAITFFDAYRQSAACDQNCASLVIQSEAQAYDQYGQLLAREGNQPAAITEFEALQTLFPTSSLAVQAHFEAAKAYYAIAQQQRASNCRSAIPTYQELANHYGDTQQGVSAKAALAGPVQVTGTLTGFPTTPLPIVYLSSSAYSVGGTYQFSDDYASSIDYQTGAFTFSNVVPQTYYLSFSSGNYWIFTGTNQLFTWQIGPLCPYSLGTLKW